jgi:D-hydroxyproline dehydrogenase subunit beta
MDAEEMTEVHRKQEYYSKRGARVEVLDAAQVRKAEPNLRPDVAGGLRVVDDAVIYPPCAAQFLLRMALDHGATLHTGTAVKELLPEGGVLMADGTRHAAGRSVSATGPWSPLLTPGLPVRKRKGHLVITERYPGFVNHQIVELGYLKSAHSMEKGSVAFNIQPRKTGQLLIGSSRQFDEEDDIVDQEILDRMLRKALEFIPSLARLSTVRVWTGHRAATPDKLPIIGPSIVSDRIWLATGHEGLGITTSVGTGRLLADLMLGRRSEIPTDPFLPARFANGVPHHD